MKKIKNNKLFRVYKKDFYDFLEIYGDKEVNGYFYSYYKDKDKDNFMYIYLNALYDHRRKQYQSKYYWQYDHVEPSAELIDEYGEIIDFKQELRKLKFKKIQL